jgi:hypothetical protein
MPVPTETGRNRRMTPDMGQPVPYGAPLAAWVSG